MRLDIMALLVGRSPYDLVLIGVRVVGGSVLFTRMRG